MRCDTYLFISGHLDNFDSALRRCNSKQRLLLGARLEREVIEVTKELCVCKRGEASIRDIPFIPSKPSGFVIPLESGMSFFQWHFYK